MREPILHIQRGKQHSAHPALDNRPSNQTDLMDLLSEERKVVIIER